MIFSRTGRRIVAQPLRWLMLIAIVMGMYLMNGYGLDKVHPAEWTVCILYGFGAVLAIDHRGTKMADFRCIFRSGVPIWTDSRSTPGAVP